MLFLTNRGDRLSSILTHEKPSIFSVLIAEITHGSAQLKKANIGRFHRNLALATFCRNNLTVSAS